MITAEEIIEILSERDTFSGLCDKCEYAEHISADDAGPEETTCEPCSGEIMDPACIMYESIKCKAQELIDEIGRC